ncbi:MAG: 2-C-methyl-D-erythritol 2,4-cyclodiphosphate synthase [Melioribacteraceae bacterium]|nr:2-C-methyl-D-erythritol 2,4-cyclodiphosphate synthase [Melioribacteraceae bacterium]
MQQFRTGFGYDVHQLAADRKLILGGIEIPFDRGLLGHSDADVLLHAICDALLGALALGDIGSHFPDDNDLYKNIDSKILLKNVYVIIKEKGYVLSNLDSTVVMEKPKLRPHIDEMRKTISEILESEIDQIGVKATTSEKLGFVGKEEGVEAFANVLLIKKDN